MGARRLLVLNAAMHSPRQKILLIGSCGAGKSSLARVLGEMLRLPVHHLDALYWRAGWVAPSKAEWAAILETLCAGDRWIIDGNYAGTMDLRLAAADTIVFLDFPRWLCLCRAIKRSLLHRRRARPDMAPGCPERLNAEFLAWIWKYPRTQRPGLLEKLGRLRSQKEIIVLRAPCEVAAFLVRLHAGRAGQTAG